MVHSVKIVLVLVQVGTRLWVNPAQVTQVKYWARGGDTKTLAGGVYVCVSGPEGCTSTDWEFDRVLRALGGKDTGR